MQHLARVEDIHPLWYSLALVVVQQKAARHIAMQGAEDWCTQGSNLPVEEGRTSIDENYRGVMDDLCVQFFLVFGSSFWHLARVVVDQLMI